MMSDLRQLDGLWAANHEIPGPDIHDGQILSALGALRICQLGFLVVF